MEDKRAFDNRVVKHPIFKSLVSWCCVLTPIHITLRTSVVSSLRRGLLLLLIAGYSLMNNEWTRVSSSVLLENEAALASRKTDNTYLFGGREFGYLTDEQLFFPDPNHFWLSTTLCFFSSRHWMPFDKAEMAFGRSGLWAKKAAFWPSFKGVKWVVDYWNGRKIKSPH